MKNPDKAESNKLQAEEYSKHKTAPAEKIAQIAQIATPYAVRLLVYLNDSAWWGSSTVKWLVHSAGGVKHQASLWSSFL